jgi:hypothetical protein
MFSLFFLIKSELSKMKKLIIIGLLLFTYVYSSAQDQQKSTTPPPPPPPVPAAPEMMKPGMTEIWNPEVKIIQPAPKDWDAPSDAIILFDGSDINKEWTGMDGKPSIWTVKDGAMVSTKGSGYIKSKRVFGDFQLHIEWKTPSEVSGNSQGRGNSGVFLQELYEVQVLDSYDNRTYRNGQAGAMYKQYAPLVNVCRKPGEWQSYDIVYTAPRFASDSLTYFTPPRVTVFQNGVLIQNNVSLRGPTQYIGIPEYTIKKHGPLSILLQDHGNPVAYRNIWVREL